MKIISELFDDDLKITDTETSVEINHAYHACGRFAVIKFKHSIKKKKD